MRAYFLIFSINLIVLLSCKSTHESKIEDEVKEASAAVSDTQKLKQHGYKNSNIDALPDYFFDQTWEHHYEEDKGDILCFKPASVKSRPSRFRNQLIVTQDGTCQNRWLAPNDAHEMRDASWAYFPDKIYILENKVDIISMYEVVELSDTLSLMREIPEPINKISGKWKLVMVEDQDFSSKGYTIDINDRNIIIHDRQGNSDTYEMSHSPWRLQEPLALHFDPKISYTYPWIGSGHYGVINDTLLIEIDVNKNSKFIRSY